MNEAENHIAGLYPIGTVAELTGINPVTLRAWERRYGLIKPQRTPTGHRIYTDEDIREIRRVIALLERGIPISQVRRALDADPPQAAEAAPSAEGPWSQYRNRFLRAVYRFDEEALDEVYNEALSLYPVELITECLILPMLHDMRGRSGATSMVQAEAGFLRSYLRNKAGARFHHKSTQAQGPRLMAACLPGENGALELLLFGLAAMGHGVRLVLLRSDVPLDGLPVAVDRSGSRGLVLYGNERLQPTVIQDELPALVGGLRVPVFVVGRVASDQTRPLMATGAVPLPGEADEALRRIGREVLGRK